jgi:chromosome segregation ATPase
MMSDLVKRLRAYSGRTIHAEAADHIEELQKQLAEVRLTTNTFWACKEHTHNNTLRCACCDEQRIAELEKQLEAANGHQREWGRLWSDLIKLEAQLERSKVILKGIRTDRKYLREQLKAVREAGQDLLDATGHSTWSKLFKAPEVETAIRNFKAELQGEK